jgi:uncharacterized protein YjbI with pentapeptide repeats
MKIETKDTKQGGDFAKLAADLTKAVAVTVPLLIAAQPGAAMAALSASAPSVIDAAMALYSAKGGSLGTSAWSVASSAFALALAKIIATGPISRRPNGAELELLIGSMLVKARINVNEKPQELSIDALYSPLKIPFVRDAVKALPHELKLYSLGCPVIDCRVLFEACMVDAFTELRNSKPDLFSRIENALSGPFATAIERRKSLGRHHDFIIRSFTQRPVFGQEETGVTLEDLYVRQRALWNTKELRKPHGTQETGIVDPTGSFFQDEMNKSPKWLFPLHVGDLHGTIWEWLDRKESGDAIRVIAGGPGSGKSTFARSLAIEVIDRGSHDVLFVPLQEIEATGSFQARIENLFRNRTDLGLDRVESPLNWLGQRDPDGRAPEKPLLIICDGLDEIAPPGSSEAATVTTDFIQTLGSWVHNRNSGGLFVSAIVLGRTISAQEAFRKLSVDHHTLIRVGGLLPITNSREWIQADRDDILFDSAKLCEIDQRKTFWDNWCQAINSQNVGLPVALQGDTAAAKALEELTTEPLLLYLLLWTGYLGENWEKAADNRNHVYEAIFQQIYARRWGHDRDVRALANQERGGHAGTTDLLASDFFLLQEALGLASWATGGRTVSAEAFQPMLKLYLDRDKYDDLSEGISSLLKSVALQSYTRSVGADSAGFEFVHKTIGEYLIARGLTSWIQKSVSPLEARISDARCAEAAGLLSKIIWKGSLTPEIARFLEDEVRLRFSVEKQAQQFLEERLVPIGNWVLKNGLPVHTALTNSFEVQPYLLFEQAEQRSLDVFWTGFQAIAKQAFRPDKFEQDPAAGGWYPGPIRLDWPSPHGFLSLFAKLAAPNLISENKRLARFDFLDLRDQAVTDSTFGAVVFYYDERDKSVRPQDWLPISLEAANLAGAQFYGSNLAQANLSRANLEGANLSRANLLDARLWKANLANAKLQRAVFSRANLVSADFRDSELGGAKFFGSNLKAAQFSGADFAPESRYDGTGVVPTIFSGASLEGANFRDTDLANAVFSSCDCDEADFRGCSLGDVIVLDTSFEGAMIDRPVLSTVEIDPVEEKQKDREEHSLLLFRRKENGVQVTSLIDDL